MDLVGADGDTVGFGERVAKRDGGIVAVVPEGEGGARFRHGFGDRGADSGGCAGDADDATGEAELFEDVGGGVGGGEGRAGTGAVGDRHGHVGASGGDFVL